MNIRPNHLHIILALLENTNLPRHTGRTEFRYPQPNIQHIRERDGRKEIAMRRDDQTDLLRTGCLLGRLAGGAFGVGIVHAEWVHAAVFDEIGIGDCVEECGIYSVVQMRVHVIVEPESFSVSLE